MNTNPEAKRILLYGDSLVYGKASGKNERLDSKTRFSGVLQGLLGGEYEVIEEGLRARMIAGENSFFPDRDGLAQFPSIVGSHLPVDLLVILLGSNDCNAKANKSPQEIASALKGYSPILKNWCEFLSVPEPKLLIVSPPHVDEAYYDEAMTRIFGEGAGQRSKELAPFYEQVAENINAAFLDAAKVCQPAAGDGIHLDPENNLRLAEALYEKVKQTG